MGRIKEFMMHVSEEMGMDGQLTKAVQQRAAEVLKNTEARNRILAKMRSYDESQSIPSKQEGESKPSGPAIPGGTRDT